MLEAFYLFIIEKYFHRAQFSVEEAEVNMLHGSDSPETAEKELSKFFAVEQTLAVIKPDAMSEKGATVKHLYVVVRV